MGNDERHHDHQANSIAAPQPRLLEGVPSIAAFDVARAIPISNFVAALDARDDAQNGRAAGRHCRFAATVEPFEEVAVANTSEGRQIGALKNRFR